MLSFFFFLFVCMYGFNFLNSEKYWKMSLFCFQNADLLLLYLTHSFLCYSLLNMFVTVAVINVKLLAVWGYVAFLHVSTLCAAVSYTLYGHEYEWDWDQVSGLNHHSCCARVCVNVRIMCVCMLLPVIMWARLLTIQKVYTKMFWVHSVYCWLCVKKYWH